MYSYFANQLVYFYLISLVNVYFRKRVKEAMMSSTVIANNNRIPLSFDYIIETEFMDANCSSVGLDSSSSSSSYSGGGHLNVTDITTDSEDVDHRLTGASTSTGGHVDDDTAPTNGSI